MSIQEELNDAIKELLEDNNDPALAAFKMLMHKCEGVDGLNIVTALSFIYIEVKLGLRANAVAQTEIIRLLSEAARTPSPAQAWHEAAKETGPTQAEEIASKPCPLHEEIPRSGGDKETTD